MVAEVLLDHVPNGTDISAIELTLPDGHWRVCVRTLTPGHVIGRRGATADAVRVAIAEKLGYSPSAARDRRDRRPGRPSAGNARWRPGAEKAATDRTGRRSCD